MMEVPFVWGQPFNRYNPDVQQQTEVIDQIDFVDKDNEYSYFMMVLWTNFAKFG